MQDLWKNNREFTAMIAIPGISITLVLFPEIFVFITLLLFIGELALVIIGPIPVDPAVVETDKILSPWILNLKKFFSRNRFTRLLGSLPSIAFIPFGLHYIWNLLHNNPLKFYGISVVVASSDVMQYYIGKHFGKHYPLSISPKKTLEGYIGGGLLCVFQSFIMLQTNSNGTVPSLMSAYYSDFLKGIYLVIFGVAGDLFNAFWKRIMGIKDSSSILGSHGGIHDRFGSAIVALAFSEFFGIEFDFSNVRIIAILMIYVFGASILVINNLAKKYPMTLSS